MFAWWKRPSPHRRRRDNEHEKPAALDIEDQHDDSEWISFLKSEVFWTLEDEFYNPIFEFEEIEMKS